MGQIRSGRPHGRGFITWPSGDRYEGDFVNGKRTGRGTYTWPSGNRYEGEWRNNKRTGWGKFAYASGGYDEGEWRDGELIRLSEQLARQRELEREREEEEWRLEEERMAAERRRRSAETWSAIGQTLETILLNREGGASSYTSPEYKWEKIMPYRSGGSSTCVPTGSGVAYCESTE